MAGGIYFDKRRKVYRVYYPWNRKRLWFDRYSDGQLIFDRERAERVLASIRYEVEKKIFDPVQWGKDKTLLVPNAWKIYMAQNVVGSARMEQRDRIWETYILPHFATMMLPEIKEHHLKDWFVNKIPQNLSPSYRRLIRATFRAFLNEFQITRKEMMRFPKITIPKKKLPWITEEEQQKIIEATDSHHRKILRVLCAYGMRVSEACNLQRTDIDWERKEITLRNRKNFEDNILPVLPEIEEDLKGGMNLHYVFSTATGAKYTRQVVYALWIRASKKAGVRVIPLKNGTRTSLACRLKNKGIANADIARILGNSEEVVESSYARTTTERVAQVFEMSLKTVNGDGNR